MLFMVEGDSPDTISKQKYLIRQGLRTGKLSGPDFVNIDNPVIYKNNKRLSRPIVKK
jgi:hypothetical protein